ncbi:MAG: cytochrome c3 family protein [Nitrospirota bacterium]
MRRFLAVVFLLFPLLCLSGAAYADTFACLACHSAMKGKVRTEKGALVDVNVDGNRYASSVHGSLDCVACHKQFSANPHAPVQAGGVPGAVGALASRLTQKAKADPVAQAACADCHSDIYKAWQNSAHGRNIIDKKQADGPLCTDCHGSPHYITPKGTATSPVSYKNIVETCGTCHEQESLAKKYNFSTHILESYYASFHGKKYVIGHQNAPTCVSCHGAHEVMEWDHPKSPVAWENRTTTCGTCHPGATKKFVTAISHQPLGKDNPIPYYFEKGLIVLLLGVFTFITGHVVLEAYSEIRDKVFRKGKEDRHE